MSLGGARWVTRRRSKCHYVDLEALRRSGGEYLGLLGSHTRYNVRRSIREYEKLGPLVLESAASPEQASAFLSGLRQLHQAYWQQKGLPGSFANPFFNEFHAELIRSHFAEGAIQLLRMSAGKAVLGYLYNFVDQGRVYNYQSGYDYELCPKQYSRPGFVTHVYAVEFNRTAGHHIYDFMAGDSEYKQTLGLGFFRHGLAGGAALSAQICAGRLPAQDSVEETSDHLGEARRARANRRVSPLLVDDACNVACARTVCESVVDLCELFACHRAVAKASRKSRMVDQTVSLHADSQREV